MRSAWRALAGSVLVLTALTGCQRGGGVVADPFGADGESVASTPDAPVGYVGSVGLGLALQMDGPVTLLSLEPLSKSPHLELLGVGAWDFSELPTVSGVPAGIDGDVTTDPAYAPYRHDVTGFVVKDKQQQSFLGMSFRVVKPGDYTMGGWKLRYSYRGKPGTVEFHQAWVRNPDAWTRSQWGRS